MRKPAPAVGPSWVLPPGPSGTIASIMTSIHRTSGSSMDTMTAHGLHGKEGVIGSSPMEGSFRNPRSWCPPELLEPPAGPRRPAPVADGFRVDPERPRRVRVAQLRHDVGGVLALCDQPRREAPAQRVRRQALRERAATRGLQADVRALRGAQHDPLPCVVPVLRSRPVAWCRTGSDGRTAAA